MPKAVTDTSRIVRWALREYAHKQSKGAASIAKATINVVESALKAGDTERAKRELKCLPRLLEQAPPDLHTIAFIVAQFEPDLAGPVPPEKHRRKLRRIGMN